MFNKFVTLNVFCSEIPCEILIVSEEGNLLKQLIIKSHDSKICFCTNTCNIFLIAIFRNKIVRQILYLSNNFCQIHDVMLITKSITNNLIKLIDANYGFPVIKAQLQFIKSN